MESAFAVSTPLPQALRSQASAARRHCARARPKVHAPRVRQAHWRVPSMCAESKSGHEASSAIPEATALDVGAGGGGGMTEASETGSMKAVGKKVKLQQLLCEQGVASAETCALLIRNGQVRVNGAVVREGKARVLKTDAVEVSGRVLGAVADDTVSIPRAQRDFGRREVGKHYTRRIDGGFFAQRNRRKRR